MKCKNPLIEAIRYGWQTLVSRPLYLVSLVLVPIGVTLCFISLMDRGVATKVPTAIVDLDQSTLSRKVALSMSSSQMIDVIDKVESFHEACRLVRDGKIYGFFLIPADFQKEAIGGGTPTLSYYCNISYFVPGTMVFKGFKTTAVTTTGALVKTTLAGVGVGDDAAMSLIQPVVVQQNGLNNPWMNYNYYLTNSFSPATLALMIAIVAAFTIMHTVKRGVSRRWLELSGDSVLLAVVGMLLPQAIVATCVGWACQAIMFGFCHFPMNGPLWHMLLAMPLLVIATQAFAVIFCCILPNLRFAVSLCSLFSILAFSIAAFSFPVPSMYPAVGIFSYVLPIRYYFEIYIDQALNGIPLYYSRFYFVGLLIFPLVALIGLPRLRRHLMNPVYIP